MGIGDKKGNVIIIALVLVMLMAITAGAFLGFINNNSFLTRRINSSERAFYLAETGLSRAMYLLRLDLQNDASAPAWNDGEINGISCGPDTSNFYVLPLASTTLGNGSYTVNLKNVSGEKRKVWIRSTGTEYGISRTVECYATAENINVWNNAIFAGAGASGALINGNVDIRGSVHILGNTLGSTDLAMDMSGSAKVGNNYSGMPVQMIDKAPACPMVNYNGETVESLGSVLRVKKGKVGLSGTAVAGEPNQSGNLYKETLDGVFVTDGYGGNQGALNVNSDNGSGSPYDLGDMVQFPSLNDPYGGYSTYTNYLRANALVISNASELAKLANVTPNSSFSYSDAKGSISMDGNGNLTISGIVYLDGGSLGLNKNASSNTINYTGVGTIYASAGAAISASLLTTGSASYPSNIIGVMTPGDISFDTAQIGVMGLFYASNQISLTKQTYIAGTIVSNFFNMGAQVPSIYQVPAVADNLPPGMIGSGNIWIIKVNRTWREK